MKLSLISSELFQFDRSETPGDVVLLRLIEIVMVGQILFFVWSWANYMSLLSDVVLPLGVANYLDITFLFQYPLAQINAFLISLFLLSGFFRKWKFSYLIALLLMHFQYAARFSQGEISHGSNLTAMLLLSFALGAIFFENRTMRRRVVFGFIIFFAGFGYVSSAVCKLIGTGPTWSDGIHMLLWMTERATDRLSQTGTFEFNRLQELMFEYYWLSTMILSFGLLTELSGFLLWFRKTRWIQATLLIMMHVGILLTMNIYFGPYIYILFVAGYPWNKLFDNLYGKFPELSLWKYVEPGPLVTKD